MKADLKFILIPIVAILVFGGALFYFNKKDQPTVADTQTSVPDIKVERHGAYSKGPENAKVTVVEFFDPECEGCAAFHPVLQNLLKEYPTNVRLVARYMLFHGNSQPAALALEGAGRQGKYWEMYNFLLERQNEWSHQDKPVTEVFAKFAKELNLNVDELNKVYDDFTLKSLLAQDVAEGQKLGVRGTPTFFVNGKMLMQLSRDDLKAAIDAELAR